MTDAIAATASSDFVAAMTTPALLIVGTASLVASALMRMARIVDRARALSAAVHAESWRQFGVPSGQLRSWLDRHALRARQVELSILMLYSAVVVFVATCVAIAMDRTSGHMLGWMPAALALAGAALFLVGGVCLVAESRASARQIAEEIAHAVARLNGEP